jgi:hypothetical protein
MDIQRLRNLTTGRLHTDISCVYTDLEQITGQRGLMTHMLPRIMNAVEPWLRQYVTDSRFWEDKCDASHVGDFMLPEPTAAERKAMLENYLAQPNPLQDKTVIAIHA